MAAPERKTASLKEEANYIKKTREINSNEPPRARIKRLEAEKVLLEEEIQRLTLTLPVEFRDFRTREHFLDEEGFPRSDIDVYNIRHTRVTLLQKHEDLRKIMKQLDTSLQEVFKAISERKKEKTEDKIVSEERETEKRVATSTIDETEQVKKAKPSLWTLEPFYRVESVVENSPSYQCGLKSGDHIVRFGTIIKENFTQTSFVRFVQNSMNRAIEVVLRRNPEGIVELNLVPQTWDGRGVLGCRFVNM